MAETLDSSQYLTFRLGEEVYAMSVASIREILEVPRITRVPRMPPYLEGIINLRGNVIPVLDLALKFGIGETPITKDTSIIVAEISGVFREDPAETVVVGVYSDMVLKVVEISPEAIEPPPVIGTSIDTSFIRGMGKIDDEFVIVLRLDSVLSEDDWSAEDRQGGQGT